MDKRVIVLLFFLVYITASSTVEANIFSHIANFFTHHKSDDNDIAERHKRITSDEGYKAVGLEHHGFRNGARDDNEQDEEAVRRSVDEEFNEIWNIKSNEHTKKVRSLSEQELDTAGKTKILEQRATLRIKSNDDDRKEKRRKKGKYDYINVREEKEMSSIKTVSSLSVPVNNEGSASGDDDDGSLTEVSTWPKGRYGLPKPVFGCPRTFGFRWKTGFRYHDTEDDGTENQRSDVFHLAANFSEDGISHEFCIKDDVEGEGEWPSGKYCIYKRGPLCPNGLKDGFVIWDDENTDNQNDKGGALPEGEYSEDTKIYFCCSTSGAVDNQISLPAKKPFFLFAYESIKCQRVLNMKSTSEFIKFDDEDHGNTDHEAGQYPYGIHKFQKDHMLFLCYYEPTKPVRSYNYETAVGTNLAEEEASDEIDQESIRQSEEIMQAFMKATGGVEDKNNKKERTKTIIKTIKVPDRSKSSPMVTVVGLVMGSIVIGTVIIFIAKMVIYKPIEKSSRCHPNEQHTVETTWVPPNVQRLSIEQHSNRNKCFEGEASDISDDMSDDMSEKSSVSCYTPVEHDSWSDIEEDDELVEDQLLPDSELKGGLELLFLKQQRHYWNQRNRHDRHDRHDRHNKTH